MVYPRHRRTAVDDLNDLGQDQCGGEGGGASENEFDDLPELVSTDLPVFEITDPGFPVQESTFKALTF